MDDCRSELHGLLNQEVLRGASLLIMSNKSDLDGAMNVDDVAKVKESIDSQAITVVFSTSISRESSTTIGKCSSQAPIQDRTSSKPWTGSVPTLLRECNSLINLVNTCAFLDLTICRLMLCTTLRRLKCFDRIQSVHYSLAA